MSDPAMQDALYGVQSMRAFAGLEQGEVHPDDTTILKFRRLLHDNDLVLKLPTALTRT